MTTRSSLPADCAPQSTRPRVRPTEQGLHRCRPFRACTCGDEPMISRCRVVAAALAGLALASAASKIGAAEKFRHLTGAQIRERFVGMDLGDDVHWRDTFRRDGT